MNECKKFYKSISFLTAMHLLIVTSCSTNSKKCNLDFLITEILNVPIFSQISDSSLNRLQNIEINSEDTLCQALKDGYILIAKKEYSEAKKKFDYVSTYNMYNPYVYFGQAIILSKNKDYENAISYFTKVIELESSNTLTAYAYALRSDVKFKEGDESGSISDSKKSLKVNPAQKSILVGLALYYSGLNKLDSSLKYINTAISLYPSEYELTLIRSYIYQYQKDYISELEDLNTYLKYFPDDELNLFHRSELYEQLQKYNYAIIDLKRLYKLEKFDFYLYRIAANYALLNNSDSSTAYIRKLRKDMANRNEYNLEKFLDDDRFSSIINTKKFKKLFTDNE